MNDNLRPSDLAMFEAIGVPPELLKQAGVERVADAVLVTFVEAEKSALAILAASERTERHILAIATGGCWGWRGRIGKTTDANAARWREQNPRQHEPAPMER